MGRRYKRMDWLKTLRLDKESCRKSKLTWDICNPQQWKQHRKNECDPFKIHKKTSNFVVTCYHKSFSTASLWHTRYELESSSDGWIDLCCVTAFHNWSFFPFSSETLDWCQGWVQLHKLTSNIYFNYNYTYIMLYSITPCSLQLQFNFARKWYFYFWNFGLIDFSYFPYLACCLVTLPLSLAMLFGSIIIVTTDIISCVGQLN